MAEALRAYEGFDSLNRAPLSRWLIVVCESLATRASQIFAKGLQANRPPKHRQTMF